MKKDKSKSIIENQKVQKLTLFEKLYFSFFLIIPFIYSDKIIDPVLIPRQFFLTIFVSVVGIMIFYQISIKKINNDFRFLKSKLFFSFLILILAYLISFFQSNLISESIYIFSKIVIESLFLVFTIYLIIQQQLSLQLLAKSVILLLIIVVITTIIQIFNLYSSGNDFSEYIYEINSTIGHKNLISSLIFIAFPFFSITLFMTKKWRNLSIILILLLISLIWILQTRTVLLAFIFFGLTFFVMMLLKRNKLSIKFSIKPIFLFSVALFVSLTIFTVYNKEKFNRVLNTDSVTERLSIWENTNHIIKENFLFGVGAGNWRLHFPENGLDKFPNPGVRNGITAFQRPHNDFLWVFSETGIIGFVAYLAIFCILLYYLTKLFKYSTSIKDFSLYSALFASIVGYCFIALTDFPFERIEHQLLLFLLFSIIFSEFYLKIQNSKLEKTNSFKLKYIVLIFLFSTITSFIVCSNRYQGELHNHLLYENHRNLNWTSMIDEVDETENYFYRVDPTSVPISWYKGVALFSLGNNTEAKIAFEKAYEIAPYNIHVLNNLATCYANLGETKKAIQYFKKALSISSNFEESILNLSGLYFNIQEYEKAYLTIINCNLNSSNSKYIKFLYPILTEKVNSMILVEEDTFTKNKLKEIQLHYDDLMQLYIESKKNNITFDKYIISSFNHE